MSKKQAQLPPNHLSITALQLELRDGTIICANERGTHAIGASASVLEPAGVAAIIQQAMNGAFRLRRLASPYPYEPYYVADGSLKRILVYLADERAARDRCTLVRLLSKDGHTVTRIAASSEAIANRDLYPRHLRSIYLYAYSADLEGIRLGIDAKILPILMSIKGWGDPR